MSEATPLILLVIAMVGFWFIFVRPTRQQQRRVAELQAELAPCDEVIISAGILGTVRGIADDRVELEIAEGTVITVARQVVVRRVPEDEPGAGEDATGQQDEAPEAGQD